MSISRRVGEFLPTDSKDNVTTASTHSLPGRDSARPESQRQFLPTDSKDNVTTAPIHTLPGRDPARPESLLTGKLGVAETSKVATLDYIYYRIYDEDGGNPSKTAADPMDPFLGRIKATSVPPPHRDTVEAVKRTIAKTEKIENCTSSSLFPSPYSQSPMGNADKFTFNRTGPGSTPQDPLAFVAKISGSALESGGMGGLASAADSEPDTTVPEIQYLYYLLYDSGHGISSKVAFDPKEPSLGRIRADSVTPPHSLTAIKRCISKVEKNPALVLAEIYADISSNTSLKEGPISILRTDFPGLSLKAPMAIVREDPSLPDGKYVIKNRAADIYWKASNASSGTFVVKFKSTTEEKAHYSMQMKWNLSHSGIASDCSDFVWGQWVSNAIPGTTSTHVPFPWRLIRAGTSKFYYLTTDMDHASRNPLVFAAQPSMAHNVPGLMAPLEEGNQWQMWEFIPCASENGLGAGKATPKAYKVYIRIQSRIQRFILSRRSDHLSIPDGHQHQ